VRGRIISSTLLKNKIKDSSLSPTLYWTVGAVRRKDHLFHTVKKIKIKDFFFLLYAILDSWSCGEKGSSLPHC
jgi:hypothetical protein